jgi:hypothetical protein
MKEEKQPIYKKMDKEFESFVVNNIGMLERMKESSYLDLRKLKGIAKSNLCSINMLKEPYSIAVIYKEWCWEGFMYYFLDEHMDKIYSYYDVK